MRMDALQCSQGIHAMHDGNCEEISIGKPSRKLILEW